MNNKDTRSPIERFYDDQVRELASHQANEAVRDQVAAAFKAPPTTADGVDAWFEENFQHAPVSHDTQLYNQLYALKAQLREIFAEKA